MGEVSKTLQLCWSSKTTLSCRGGKTEKQIELLRPLRSCTPKFLESKGNIKNQTNKAISLNHSSSAASIVKCALSLSIVTVGSARYKSPFGIFATWRGKPSETSSGFARSANVTTSAPLSFYHYTSKEKDGKHIDSFQTHGLWERYMDMGTGWRCFRFALLGTRIDSASVVV